MNTSLLTRINDRRQPIEIREPQPITERMSPFMRRLREKNLQVKELYNGAYVPRGSDGAA
jgi:hypothetical protein